MMYFLSPTRIPSEKAESIAIVKNIDALLSEGCMVKLLLPKSYKLNKKELKSNYGLKNCLSIFQIPCLSFFRRVTNSKFRWLLFQIMVFSYVFSCISFISKDKEKLRKLIFVRDASTLRHLYKFRKILKNPIIFEIHQLPNFRNKKDVEIIKSCKLLITISDYQKSVLEKNGINSKKIFCLRSAYDDRLFSNTSTNDFDLHSYLKIPKDSKIVLYSGSLAAWKQIDLILKSEKYFDENIFLVLLGGTKSQISNLKKITTNTRIKFIERVPLYKVPSFLHQADILLHSMSQDSTNLTSFSPLKLIEYLAIGKPIVTPDLPWIREIINDGKNGLLYDPQSPVDLSKKINELVKEESLRNKIISEAVQAPKNFTYSNRAKKLIFLIETEL